MNEQMTPAREAEIRVKLEREAKAHGSVHFVPPKAGMVRDLLGEIDRLRAELAEYKLDLGEICHHVDSPCGCGNAPDPIQAYQAMREQRDVGRSELDRLRKQVAQVVAEVERFGIYGSATSATKALVKRADELVDENARLKARIAELHGEGHLTVADVVAWLCKKAGEYGVSNRENRAKAEAVGRMADKISRGAIRPTEGGVR